LRVLSQERSLDCCWEGSWPLSFVTITTGDGTGTVASAMEVYE